MMVSIFAACSSKTAQSPDTSTPPADTATNTPAEAESSEDGSSEKKQITMWFWGAATDYQAAMKRILCGWYNNSQDEYELSIEFRNTVDVDIPRALAAGNAPDIVYASGPSYTATYVQEGLVMNLDAY